MDNQTPEFTSELVDAQVDRLLARPFPFSQNTHIVDDLQKMYQGDEQSLRNVWQRLGLENQQQSSVKKQLQMFGTIDISQPPTGPTVFNLERRPPLRQTSKRSLTRVFSLLAAACVAALIVGSMLFIANQAHQDTLPATIPSQTPQAVYGSNYTSIFKLDAQTHQVLWQQPLKGVLKIVSSGKVVYILQSTERGGITNAVLELSASSGKTLWIYTFPAQKQNTGPGSGFISDMVLAQDRLYIGWQTEGALLPQGGESSTAQIFVLKTSDGSKLMAYAATDDVWNIAAGAGVLAVSAAGSLQVYDLTTGIARWHIPFPSNTNAPASSLQIVNGLIYAVVLANNAETSQTQSSIRVYKATTGVQVWQSPAFASDAISSFAVNQQRIYFGVTQPGQKTSRVYAYDIQNNKQLWSMPISGVTTPYLPIFSAGVIYLGVSRSPGENTQAYIVAINATTGSLKWKQTLSGDEILGFCLASKTIYVSSFVFSQDGPLSEKSYALKASDGTILSQDLQQIFVYIVPGE
jgi:outer membrane protein assembly factor BamB